VAPTLLSPGREFGVVVVMTSHGEDGRPMVKISVWLSRVLVVSVCM
jgi:hypothetical protein